MNDTSVMLVIGTSTFKSVNIGKTLILQLTRGKLQFSFHVKLKKHIIFECYCEDIRESQSSRGVSNLDLDNFRLKCIYFAFKSWSFRPLLYP